MIRHRFLFTAAIVAALFSSCDKTAQPKDEIPMIIGTYTGSGSYGVYSLNFDQENGTFTLRDSLKAVNPSYLVFSPDRSMIYSVNEVEDEKAGVSSIAFDPTTGKMTLINGAATESGAPCYIATNGKIVVAANYTGGTMSVFPLAEDGSIGNLAINYAGSIGGPDSTRQELPHVHCAEFSVDGKYLYASDFSADRLMTFVVTDEGGSVIPLLDEQGEPVTVPLESDYGPRHIIFDKSGKHAYVIGELSGKVTVFDYENGKLTPKQVIDGDPYDGRGSADIKLSHDGKYLYTSNRLKDDGLAIFAVDEESGELTYKGYQHTGVHPRNFNITPNDRYLLVACRDTNEIEIFERDETTGLLTETGSISLPAPVCIEF